MVFQSFIGLENVVKTQFNIIGLTQFCFMIKQASGHLIIVNSTVHKTLQVNGHRIRVDKTA